VSPSDRAFKFDVNASVLVQTIIRCDPVSHALGERVAVRETCLFLVADASIKILLSAGIAPEGDESRFECIVDQFRNGTVKSLDELGQVGSILEVAQHVVMVAEKRSDPGNKVVFAEVAFKAVPEDRLGVLSCKSLGFVATARGDEVDLIVDQPMLEPVLVVVNGVCGVGDDANLFSH